MTDEIRALLAQMAKELDNYLQCTVCDPKVVHPLATRARAAMDADLPAQPPAPVTASDGEREAFAQWLDRRGAMADLGVRDSYFRAAALLRQPAPAPVPVPVAERPWERPGWCDAEGRCWWFAPTEATAGGFRSAGWGLYAGPPADEDTHCLPRWALPIPQPPQCGEVQRWPETFSRRQRAEEAARLCTEAGIDLKSPDAQRLVQDAEDGMPLHDVLDLIRHWNATATTPPSSNEAT